MGLRHTTSTNGGRPALSGLRYMTQRPRRTPWTLSVCGRQDAVDALGSAILRYMWSADAVDALGSAIHDTETVVCAREKRRDAQTVLCTRRTRLHRSAIHDTETVVCDAPYNRGAREGRQIARDYRGRSRVCDTRHRNDCASRTDSDVLRVSRCSVATVGLSTAVRIDGRLTAVSSSA